MWKKLPSWLRHPINAWSDWRWECTPDEDDDNLMHRSIRPLCARKYFGWVKPLNIWLQNQWKRWRYSKLRSKLRYRFQYRVLPWWDRRLEKRGLMRVNLHKGKMAGAEHRINEIRRETDELKASLGRVLPELVKLSMYRNPSTAGRYRLCVDLDEFTIRGAFQHGNDQQMIRCVGEQIGYMVVRELLTVNMHRFAEPPFQYPRG